MHRHTFVLKKKHLQDFVALAKNKYIELGRKMGIARFYRICLYCLNQTSLVVEDEYHVFLECD